MSNENGPNDPYDDEMEGLIDCQDTECVGQLGPSGAISIHEQTCDDGFDNDGIDNDGDGYFDCDDVPCSEPPAYGAKPASEIKPILGRILGIQPQPLPDEAIVHEIDETDIVSVNSEVPSDIQEEVATTCEAACEPAPDIEIPDNDSKVSPDL